MESIAWLFYLWPIFEFLKGGAIWPMTRPCNITLNDSGMLFHNMGQENVKNVYQVDSFCHSTKDSKGNVTPPPRGLDRVSSDDVYLLTYVGSDTVLRDFTSTPFPVRPTGPGVTQPWPSVPRRVCVTSAADYTAPGRLGLQRRSRDHCNRTGSEW